MGDPRGEELLQRDAAEGGMFSGEQKLSRLTVPNCPRFAAASLRRGARNARSQDPASLSATPFRFTAGNPAALGALAQRHGLFTMVLFLHPAASRD